MFAATAAVISESLADIAISPTSIDYAVGGGGAAVKTSGTGSWTAECDVNWITIVKASGNAGESCTYIVSKNNSADSREGHIDISGNTYTVTQKGCTVSLSPTSVSIGKFGGTGTFTVGMDAGVTWTADTSAPWITVSPQSGIGATEVTYTIAEYNQVGSRIGTIRIGSEKLTVNQSGVDVTLSPVSTNVTKDVCIVPIQVVAMSDTTWSIVPNVSWISVLDSGNGFGGSQVTIVVAENPSFEKRTGTVSVGSATITVVQSGTDDVRFKILPEVAKAPPKGAFANVAVYATPDADWTTESMDNWIKITDGEAGKGNGNVKYVTMSNPELESRTGRIKFIPPVYTPELDLYSGMLFWITNQVNIEGNDFRSATYSLNKTFDGSFSNPLTGALIPCQANNDFSLAFSFNIGELECLNRILKLGNHSIYVDADNILCYNHIKTPYEVLSSNADYTMLIRYQSTSPDKGKISIYAGQRGTELIPIWESSNESKILNLMDGIMMSNFTFGYCTYPSTGYWGSGQIANVRFWSRALSDLECKYVDDKWNEVLELTQVGAPEDSAIDFFALNGNSLGSDGTNIWPSGEKYKATATMWVNAENRNRNMHRALQSLGDGVFKIEDFNSLFSGSYYIPSGVRATYGYSGTWHTQISISHDPVTRAGSEVDASIVVWFKITELPTTPVSLINRMLTRTSYTSARWGNGLDYHNNPTYATATVTNEQALRNADFLVSIDPLGAFVVEGSGITKTTLSSKTVSADEWHCLAIVAVATKSMQFYLDGEDIGSISSTMTLGYLPPMYPDGSASGASPTITSYSYLQVGGWSGSLDEVAIYHKALSAREVSQIYDEGQPLSYVYHTVTQGVQEPDISPSAIEVGQQGVTTNIALTVARMVNWSASPNAPWMSVVGSSSGTGPADVMVKIDANTTCLPRQGTVTIGTKKLTVSQAGLNCELYADKTIFPTEADETGGMGTIIVSPEGNGSWTASSDVDWIYVYPESGTGSYDVIFFVEDMGSTAASRTGTISIGGKTIEITQRGYELSIEPQIAEVGGNAGAGVIGVAADADAVWTAIADVPWISIVQTTSKQVRYTFTDNTTGEARVGHINIAGELYTLTQTCKLDLNAVVIGQGTITGGGKYPQGAIATLTAKPAVGYEFSHWSGDIVGTEATESIVMDTVKNITATFIPEAAAQVIAEKKAAQGGFYTRDQIHALEVGNLVLDVDSASGTARVGVQLMETSDLSNPNSWKPIDMTQGNLDVGNDGTVGLNVKATGNAKFFKVVVPEK